MVNLGSKALGIWILDFWRHREKLGHWEKDRRRYPVGWLCREWALACSSSEVRSNDWMKTTALQHTSSCMYIYIYIWYTYNRHIYTYVSIYTWLCPLPSSMFRWHCELTLQGFRSSVEDNSTGNSTTMNGVPLPQAELFFEYNTQNLGSEKKHL